MSIYYFVLITFYRSDDNENSITLEKMINEFWTYGDKFLIDLELFLEPRKYVKGQFFNNLYNFLYVIDLVNEPLNELAESVKADIDKLQNEGSTNEVILVHLVFI